MLFKKFSQLEKNRSTSRCQNCMVCIYKILFCLGGEGNGNSLQYSCLENPRDGRAWWAAIYGVTQSRTQLKRLSSTSSSILSWSQIFICVCVCIHTYNHGVFAEKHHPPNSRYPRVFSIMPALSCILKSVFQITQIFF